MRLTFKAGILLAGAALFLTSGALTFAQKGDDATNFNGNAQRNDMHFARAAATGGTEEVELGRIAAQKGLNDKVRAFGQRMVDDHTKINDRLKALAAKDNITLPAQIDAREKAQMDRLSAMSGPAFDRAYIRTMVRDHEKDIAAFQNEASNGINPDLKNFAATTLPTLQEHLRLAKEAENAIGVTSRR